MRFRETSSQSFDKLRTNGKLLISFVMSVSNRERNQFAQGFRSASRQAGRACALALALLPAAATAAPPLPQQTLLAGAQVFRVEVASTAPQRAQGLMGRARLADDAGMLFVFEERGLNCFWMKDTLLPLSIAFLSDDGTIVGIADMQSQTTDFHCPQTAVRYALEVPQGGFRSKGIQPGMRISGGPFGRGREQ